MTTIDSVQFESPESAMRIRTTNVQGLRVRDSLPRRGFYRGLIGGLKYGSPKNNCVGGYSRDGDSSLSSIKSDE